MFEALELPQLLERWRSDVLSVALAPAESWDGYPAATAEDLAAAERRLGRALPPTYREFLSCTNGWPFCGGFVAGLRSTSTVGRFREVESDWYEIWRDMADAEDPDVSLMARALVVSTPGDQALLLDPDDVDAQTGEWRCYTFSNWAPGATDAGRSFRSGLERVYRDFVANSGVSSETLTEADDVVEQSYRAMLAGDLTARSTLDHVLRLTWRAWLLAAQFDTFGAQSGSSDLSTSVHHLWLGDLGGVATQDALSDRVLVEDLLPLYVVRLVETDRSLDGEIRRAPQAIAERMRELRDQIAAGTGPIADFSYAPAFADAVAQARRQMRDGDLGTAWETVHAALPSWLPMSANHLAPLGLYYDRDLRQLLTPPPPRPAQQPAIESGTTYVITTISRLSAEPVSRASVVPLATRKQYSERTLAVLRAPFRLP